MSSILSRIAFIERAAIETASRGEWPFDCALVVNAQMASYQITPLEELRERNVESKNEEAVAQLREEPPTEWSRRVIILDFDEAGNGPVYFGWHHVQVGFGGDA